MIGTRRTLTRRSHYLTISAHRCIVDHALGTVVAFSVRRKSATRTATSSFVGHSSDGRSRERARA